MSLVSFTLLSVNEMPSAPDGSAVCSSADNGHTTLLGSGVGENYSSGPLPESVAYKIAKGAQLNLIAGDPPRHLDREGQVHAEE